MCELGFSVELQGADPITTVGCRAKVKSQKASVRGGVVPQAPSPRGATKSERKTANQAEVNTEGRGGARSPHPHKTAQGCGTPNSYHPVSWGMLRMASKGKLTN